MRINLGSGEHYQSGWLNVDVAGSPHKADRIVEPHDPFGGFPDDSAEAIYLGHVLEHVEWPRVHRLLVDVRRVLKPGSQVCVVGPDVYQAITRWRDGLEPWDIVMACLEDASVEGWTGAAHLWNCHQSRVTTALVRAGFHCVVPFGVTEEALRGWPCVSFSEWQCGAWGIA